MRGLGQVVACLNGMRQSLESASETDDRLELQEEFGSNPGNLDCLVYSPTSAPKALVVVLHGCTQNAAVYDRGSGWSRLAELHDFAVMFPQQSRANNSNLCFNWYDPEDARRSRGEAMSISQMVQHLSMQYGLKRSQVFITGLSAGGAMTAVMLASYPELFAGGAIIAGLPFATANTLPDALERMRGQGGPRRQDLAARAKAAAPADVPPPSLSVWHGTSDMVVAPANAVAIANQWRDLHGLGDATGHVDMVNGHRREVWFDAAGRPMVEKLDIVGMGHGTPLDTRDEHACGQVGPHMLQANICSTREIARSWKLIGADASDRPRAPKSDRESVRPTPKPERGNLVARPALLSPRRDVSAIINSALRSAGLMD